MSNQKIESKREREKRTVSLMIRIYCKKKHGTRKGLCPECEALDAYARMRSDKCPFMETKTFCSNCKVHCYKADMREKNTCGHAFFRTSDDIQPSNHGDQARDRKQKREKET